MSNTRLVRPPSIVPGSIVANRLGMTGRRSPIFGRRRRREFVRARPTVQGLESRLLLTAGIHPAGCACPACTQVGSLCILAPEPNPSTPDISDPVAVGDVNAPQGSDTALGPDVTYALSGLPALSSLPGAAASLFLDFDGFYEANWGSYSNITTPAYDIDGDPTSFSGTELSNIAAIWAQVAEDYAPFRINVTTVEPPSFANGVAVRVAIGGDGAWLGAAAGGVAYVNSFTNSLQNTAYVFPKQLGNGYVKYTAEASSHEAGHTFGLQHQSSYSGTTKTAEYSTGPGDGRAPIMGVSYYATRGLWWNGQSTSSTTIQDDMAVIARSTNGFGYRPDDHGDTADTATPLTVAGTAVSGSGIIAQTSDLDVFSIDAGAGTIRLTADVPTGINDLDARLELRDASGSTLLASADPSDSFGATITATLPAGSYRLVVASHGNYGDVGQYTISGTIVAPAVVVDGTPRVADSGFESPALPGVGTFDAYRYNPAGEAWTFAASTAAGGSGVAANGSGFTSGNPAAPEGVQVAFLQGLGSIRQQVGGWAAGSYRVRFLAAQRGNYQSARQDIRVTIDGQEVATITPSATSYAEYLTAAFTVGAGSHAIAFEGLNSAGGDNTALLDNIRVEAGVTPPTALDPADSGFESPALPGVGTFDAYRYNPAGEAWTFTAASGANGSGVAANGSGFTSGNPAAPEGVQVAFLQGLGSIRQQVGGWAAGSYRVRFLAAQRGNYQSARQDIRVTIDGQEVATITPSATSYAEYLTAAFTVGAGSHAIAFEGLNSAGGDNTALLDNIRVEAGVAPPTALDPADSGFESPALPGVGTFGAYRYNPAGEAWTFTAASGANGSGVAANGSGFTSGNPAAPEGVQVAFLQGLGSIRQQVGGWAAGSYRVRFLAAQRGNYQSARQDIRVTIDGQEVATITPSATSYAEYLTAAFTVGAGSHAIAFEGLNSAGGDNTALLDNIRVEAVTPAGSMAGDLGPFETATLEGQASTIIPTSPGAVDQSLADWEGLAVESGKRHARSGWLDG